MFRNKKNIVHTWLQVFLTFVQIFCTIFCTKEERENKVRIRKKYFKVKRFVVDALPEFHDKIKSEALRLNVSISDYIMEAIYMRLERDKKYD